MPIIVVFSSLIISMLVIFILYCIPDFIASHLSQLKSHNTLRLQTACTQQISFRISINLRNTEMRDWEEAKAVTPKIEIYALV